MSDHSTTQPEQYPESPEGWAGRLTVELSSARKALKPWHDEAEKALAAYLDEREPNAIGGAKWNVYTADTQTQEALLYGNVPRVTASRRYSDAADDVARVAGVALERILNADVDCAGESLATALALALKDRQHVGFGLARVRYECEMEDVAEQPAMTAPDGRELAPVVPATQRKCNEEAATDYLHWRDVLWSPARVWHEVAWVAFGADLPRAELRKKFGAVADELPLNAKKAQASKDDAGGKNADPWGRCRVWEVWVKDGTRVFFYVEGYSRVLAPVGSEVDAGGAVPDPLGLEGFFPCPEPMAANLTTSKMVPRPDYSIARSLYEEINLLSARITLLERALAVKGVYDKSNGAVKRLLTDTGENELIPVENWAMFGEKGGLKGAVDWFPLEQIVGALTALSQQREAAVDAARQMTGMADIMRGQASEPGATATEQRIKARFGSVRMRRREQEFAAFASELQRLRAEVMAKHFDEQTLIERSNLGRTPDAQLAPQAVALIKSDLAKYRIEVKPESLSMTDFDAVKAERTEVIGAMSEFMVAAAPLAAQSPAMQPYLLQMLQWMVSGLRGAGEIEGVLDQAIGAAEQAAQRAAANPQQAQPDPKVMAQQMKSQADLAKIDKEVQADAVRGQIDAQTEDAKQMSQMHWNLLEAKARDRMKLANDTNRSAMGLGPHSTGAKLP